MRHYFKVILPSATTTLLLCILPLVLTIYFVFIHYSERFAAEQNLTYLDVQGNWLGQLLLDQKWLEWFNRFMDFAFWGMLAAILLVVIWAVGSAKTVFKNHYAQAEFTNFNEAKAVWHRHFFIVLLVRIILLFMIAFSLISVVGRYIPRLSADIMNALPQLTFRSIVPTIVTCFIIFCYEYISVVAIKVFRSLSSE